MKLQKRQYQQAWRDKKRQERDPEFLRKESNRNRDWIKGANAKTRKVAHKNGQKWAESEIYAIFDARFTTQETALFLGRTYQAVMAARIRYATHAAAEGYVSNRQRRKDFSAADAA